MVKRPSSSAPLAFRHRARAVVNTVNLTTPIGVLVAVAGGARLRRGPDGLWIGEGYRLRFPVAGAFTVGNVVITASTIARLKRVFPDIVQHEGAHATQYVLLGPAFFPLYTLCAGWSWLRAGDPAVRNIFERRAGLVSGGYLADDPRRPSSGTRGFNRPPSGRRRRRRISGTPASAHP